MDIIEQKIKHLISHEGKLHALTDKGEVWVYEKDNTIWIKLPQPTKKIVESKIVKVASKNWGL